MPNWISLLLVTLALQLPGSGLLPLMDRDEPRFAGATIEMMERETWTVPYFNDAYRFDKTPLTYWWMRLHYHLFGINELSARLHSIIATWLVSLLVFNIGKHLSGLRAAWLSALIWLSCLQVLIHGRLCVADMPMILGVTLAMRALLPLLGLIPTKERPTRSRGLLYAALAFGFLAKGPIALLVPLIALALYRWFSKRKLDWRQLRPIRGLLLTLTLIAAWGIPALIETQGLFWKVGMGEHIVKRGAEMLNGRPFIPGYYLLTFFLSFFPWSGFLIPVLKSIRQPSIQPQTWFLIAWFAAPMILFSFYATQLPHYTLPGFPALALLTGIALSQSSNARMQWPALLVGLSGLFAVLALTLAILSFASDHPPISELIQRSAWLLACLAGTAVISVASLVPTIPSRWLIVLGCLLAAVPTHFLCVSLRQHSATLAVIHHLPSDKTNSPIGWNYTEPSLVFYARSPWNFTGKAQRVEQHLKKHPKAAVVALQREWTLDHWLRHKASLKPKSDLSGPLQEFASSHSTHESQIVSGFNPARFSWVEVLVLTPPAAPPSAQPNQQGTPREAPEQSKTTHRSDDARD